MSDGVRKRGTLGTAGGFQVSQERARRLPGAARGGARLSCCTCLTVEGHVLSGEVGVRHGSGGAKLIFAMGPLM